MTRGSYLIVAYEIGKRTKKTCEKLFEKVFDRVQLPFPDIKIEIFSDGHDDYTNTIPEYYADRVFQNYSILYNSAIFYPKQIIIN